MATTGTGLWTACSGFLTHADVEKRALYEMRVSLDTQNTTVWLTDDGTSTGNSILGAFPPLVWVGLANQVAAGGGTISTQYGWGPMMDSTVASSSRQYKWGVIYSSSRWVVQINRFVAPSDIGELSGPTTAVILVSGLGAAR